MTEVKKKGRGRPKGAPNKPKMELVTKKQELTKHDRQYMLWWVYSIYYIKTHQCL